LRLFTWYIWLYLVYTEPYVGANLSLLSMFSTLSILVAVIITLLKEISDTTINIKKLIWLQETLTQIRNGMTLTGAQVTLKGFLEEWLESYKT